jgi:hypothetical protein
MPAARNPIIEQLFNWQQRELEAVRAFECVSRARHSGRSSEYRDAGIEYGHFREGWQPNPIWLGRRRAKANGWNNVTSMLWSTPITQFQEGEQELSRGHIHVICLLFH